MNKVKTLCIIERNNQVLLGMKKRGFGKGWWNGFGGKVEKGEAIEDAAIRETREEVGIQVKRMEKRGMILFHFENDPDPIEMHIFAVLDYEGEPKESEEMKPKWFKKDKIPYEKMWPADQEWMTIYLEGKHFEGEVHFTQDKRVVDFDIHEIALQEIKK